MMRKRNIVVMGVAIFVLFAIVAFAYIGLPQPEYDPYPYGSDNREKLPRMTLLNHEQIMHEVVGHQHLPVESVGILVYDGVSTLEATGSMVVFSELMNVNIKYIGLQTGTISTDLADIVVEHSIEDVNQLDVLVVPGGTPDGLRGALENVVLRD